MKAMKKTFLSLCFGILLTLCFSVSAWAYGEPTISLPDEIYKGVSAEIKASVGLFDYRNTAKNVVTVTISKDGTVKKKVSYECQSFTDPAVITYKPASTGKYVVKATNGSGLSTSASFTVKPISDANFVSSYVNTRIRFSKSTIVAETSFRQVNALANATCKAKVQIKKGTTVLKTATYTMPDLNASNFYDNHKLSYKPDAYGTYTVVCTRYINGVKAGSDTQTIKIMKKNDISTVKPILFINFDQNANKVCFFEDGITPSSVYQYKIYRSTSKDSGYKLYKTIAAKEDYEIYKYSQPSTKYYYRMKVVVKTSTKTYTSKYSNTIGTPSKIAAPKISSIEKNGSGSVVITWNKITGAENYIVNRKIYGGSWETDCWAGNVNKTVVYFDNSASKVYCKVQAYKHYTHYNIYGPFSAVKSMSF